MPFFHFITQKVSERHVQCPLERIRNIPYTNIILSRIMCLRKYQRINRLQKIINIRKCHRLIIRNIEMEMFQSIIVISLMSYLLLLQVVDHASLIGELIYEYTATYYLKMQIEQRKSLHFPLPFRKIITKSLLQQQTSQTYNSYYTSA